MKKICKDNDFIGWVVSSDKSSDQCCEEIPNQLFDSILEKMSSCSRCKEILNNNDKL